MTRSCRRRAAGREDLLLGVFVQEHVDEVLGERILVCHPHPRGRHPAGLQEPAIDRYVLFVGYASGDGLLGCKIVHFDGF